jgi:photosynthetic reaction center cytochrome c subunit
MSAADRHIAGVACKANFGFVGCFTPSLSPRAMPRYVCVVILFLLRLPIVIAQESPPSMEGKTAGEYYKNIRVLKEIPASELIVSMQFISSSLGVECDFCHVERQFDKDDKKPKEIARKMIQMQFAINQTNFDGEREVTCNTCHRGTTHPQAVPAVAQVGGGPASMEPDDHDTSHEGEMDRAKWASGAPLLSKYIEAVGGKPALDKITSRVEKGSAILPGGRSVPVNIYSKPPDARVSVMHMQGGDSVTAVNGNAGWLASPNRPPREMSVSDREAAELDAAAFYPEQLRQMFSDFKLQPNSEKVADQQASVVIATAAGQPPVKLYFDASTGLLLRMMHFTDSVLGLNPVQVDFADYRAAGGVKTPYRWTIARPSGAFTIQLSEVQDNVPIDEKLFVKPTAPASPPQH